MVLSACVSRLSCVWQHDLDAGARPRQAEQRRGPGGDAVDGLRRARRVVPQRRRLGRAVVVCGVARRGARGPLVLREAQQLVGVRAIDDARSRVDGEVVEGAEPLRGRVRVEGAQARSDTSAGAAPRNGAASSAQAPTSRAAAKDRETTAKLPASTCVVDRVLRHRHDVDFHRWSTESRLPRHASSSAALVYREPLRATRLLERARRAPGTRPARRTGPPPPAREAPPCSSSFDSRGESAALTRLADARPVTR